MFSSTALAALTVLSLAASPVVGLVAASLEARFVGTKYLFIFGDSYTATGFNPSGNKPSASNPIGNPNLPGSTFSGGWDWPGYLVTSFNTSQTLLYNYAVGGATVDSNLVAPPGSGIKSFVEQTAQWKSGAASKPSYAPWTSENTLAGAFFGINDILQSHWRNAETPLSKMVDRYFEQFQTMYAAGVRNFFLVTVPPMDKVPQITGQNAQGRSKIMTNVNSWNTQLAARLATFKGKNAGVTAVVIESAAPFNTAISSPKTYGAPDATCLNRNGKSCLWWDNLHPGEAIHKLLAAEIAKAWKDTFF